MFPDHNLIAELLPADTAGDNPALACHTVAGLKTPVRVYWRSPPKAGLGTLIRHYLVRWSRTIDTSHFVWCQFSSTIGSLCGNL